jgi:hypothetical protein
MRPNLLAALGVRGRDPEILAWGRLTARRYLEHPDSVDGSVVGTALNLAARDGDLALFEEYRTRFETTRIPSERARFLVALGNFRSVELLEKALDYALSGPLRPQEVLTIPRTLVDNEELRDQRWRWMQRNHQAIVEKVPPFSVPGLTGFAKCCDEPRIEEANSFFTRPDNDLPGTKEELAKVTDSIRDCAGLRRREAQAVVRYIHQVVRGGPATSAAPAP